MRSLGCRARQYVRQGGRSTAVWQQGALGTRCRLCSADERGTGRLFCVAKIMCAAGRTRIRARSGTVLAAAVAALAAPRGRRARRLQRSRLGDWRRRRMTEFAAGREKSKRERKERREEEVDFRQRRKERAEEESRCTTGRVCRVVWGLRRTKTVRSGRFGGGGPGKGAGLAPLQGDLAFILGGEEGEEGEKRGAGASSR